MIKNAKPPKVDSDLLDYVKNRLRLNYIEFDEIMMCLVLTYRDYPNYKKRFELLRPSFNRLAKANLVPLSFYLKYYLPAKALK